MNEYAINKCEYLGGGAQGDEVFGDDGGVATVVLENPRLGGFSISERFLCSKRLGCDDEEARLRVQTHQNLAHVGAVDVGAEVHAGAWWGEDENCKGYAAMHD